MLYTNDKVQRDYKHKGDYKMKANLSNTALQLTALQASNKEYGYDLLDTDIQTVVDYSRPAGIATKTIMDIIFKNNITVHRDNTIDLKNLATLATTVIEIPEGIYTEPKVQIRVPSQYVLDKEAEELKKLELRARLAEQTPEIVVSDTFTLCQDEEDTEVINGYMPTYDPNAPKINNNAQVTIGINVISTVKLEGVLINPELETLQYSKRNPVLPERIVLTIPEYYTYFAVGDTMLNELAFYYGVGTEIVIGHRVFKNKKPNTLLKYQYTKRSGLTNHAKKYFKEGKFTVYGLYKYNGYVAENVIASNKRAWQYAESFYKLVYKTFRNDEIVRVYSPNAKTYWEAEAEIEYTHDMQDIKGDDNILTKEQQTELDTLRKYYDIPSDTYYTWIIKRQTDNGYTEEPQILTAYEAKTLYSEEKKSANAQRFISTKEIPSSKLAYNNYQLLQAYKEMGILKEGYSMCPICGLPTKSEHLYCDNCGKVSEANQQLISEKIEEYKLILSTTNVVSMPPEAQTKLYTLAIEELGFTDNRLEELSFNILKSK